MTEKASMSVSDKEIIFTEKKEASVFSVNLLVSNINGINISSLERASGLKRVSFLVL